MSRNTRYISFTEWLAKLNACAERAGYRDVPFVQITGQQCWYGDYAAGVLPEDAFQHAEESAISFGVEYVQEISG